MCKHQTFCVLSQSLGWVQDQPSLEDLQISNRLIPNSRYEKVSKEYKPCNCRNRRNHTGHYLTSFDCPYPPPKRWLYSCILIFPRRANYRLFHTALSTDCLPSASNRSSMKGAAAFPVLFTGVWIHKVGIQPALSMCWISKGWNWSPERSQNVLKVAELDASIAFIRDLFTITLPVCSFCGHMSLTKAGCFCKGKESLQHVSFSLIFLCPKKKGPKKGTYFKCFPNKLKLYLNFISIQT